MDGPSQSQHSNSDIVIHKVSAKEARIEFKVNPSRDKQGKWRGGRTCSVVDCHNCAYRDGPRGVKFFKYPKDQVIITCRDQFLLENSLLWAHLWGALLRMEHSTIMKYFPNL